MVWFTADLHLGHANIIRHCSRPFSTVVEMDEAILSRINKDVCGSDTIWILGDFCFRGRSPSYYRERIQCRDVRLLLGNHDKRSKCGSAGFSHVGDVAEICIGGQRIWMSHYAHRSWPAKSRGSWHLYGHSHGGLREEDARLGINAIDVGVDNAEKGFGELWSFEQLSESLPRG